MFNTGAAPTYRYVSDDNGVSVAIQYVFAFWVAINNEGDASLGIG